MGWRLFSIVCFLFIVCSPWSAANANGDDDADGVHSNASLVEPELDEDLRAFRAGLQRVGVSASRIDQIIEILGRFEAYDPRTAENLESLEALFKELRMSRDFAKMISRKPKLLTMSIETLRRRFEILSENFEKPRIILRVVPQVWMWSDDKLRDIKRNVMNDRGFGRPAVAVHTNPRILTRSIADINIKRAHFRERWHIGLKEQNTYSNLFSIPWSFLEYLEAEMSEDVWAELQALSTSQRALVARLVLAVSVQFSERSKGGIHDLMRRKQCGHWIARIEGLYAAHNLAATK